MMLLVAALLLLVPASAFAQARDGKAPERDTSNHFVAGTIVIEGHPYPYAVQLPVPVSSAGPGELPVILALHGAGSRGADGIRMRSQSVAAAARKFADRYPVIVIMPQTPGRWTTSAQDAAREALSEVVSRYDADIDRVYIVGQSMGADGAIMMVSRFPHLFAAAAIAAPGCCDATYAPEKMVNTPVWIFHGTEDRIPVQRSRSSRPADQRGQCPRSAHRVRRRGTRHLRPRVRGARTAAVVAGTETLTSSTSDADTRRDT